MKNKYYLRNEVIMAYNNNINNEAIMDKYNLSWGEYYNLIAPCLEHNIANVTNQQIAEIIDMYSNNISSTRIGEKLRIHHKTVCEIIKLYDLEIHSSKSHRKYTLNENYFDNIDTPNKAYILGLLYADGYNSTDKNMIRLQLESTDKSILEMICNELNYNKPLKFINCSKRIASNGFVSKDMYSLDIYSKHLSNMLEHWGMVQNKSLTLTFPNFLNEQLYSHFLRGYFDGDGSYCHRYADNYGWRDSVTFTSTDLFCQQAKIIINNYSEAKGGGIYNASCKNGITKVLSFSGAKQVKKLLDWLYDNAELFIERKYNIYQNALAS